MKVKSGVLFWPTTYEDQFEKFTSLEEDITCDFVIVGSGVSGSLCSYFLSETDASVIVIDKRKISNGSTVANTGLLQYSNDKPLYSFINSYGKEKGVHHYQLCVDALNGLEKIVDKFDFNPDFIRRNSLYYASDAAGKEILENEYKALVENGFKVEQFTKETLKEKFNMNKDLALYTGDDAEFNPFKYSHALLQYAMRRNIKVYCDTEVVRIIGTSDGVQLFTHNKRTIKAKKVIFASGYEALEVKKEKNAILSSTFAIVTQPILKNNPWYENCLIWETARPYLYIRSTVDGRIVVGGLDEPTILKEKRESMLPHKKEQLVEKLVELLPQYEQAQAEYYWTGIFGGTHTGLPMIRHYDEFPNCFFLMGYGGNGTVYSYTLANILKGLLTVGSHPNAYLYMDYL